jgi:hypothetical protein
VLVVLINILLFIFLKTFAVNSIAFEMLLCDVSGIEIKYWKFPADLYLADEVKLCCVIVLF